MLSYEQLGHAQVLDTVAVQNKVGKHNTAAVAYGLHVHLMRKPL